PSGRSDTLAEPALPPARVAAPQPGGARPPARTALRAPSSRPGRRTESFPGFRACGKRGGHGKRGGRLAGPPSAWCRVSGPCVWRSRGGAGLSPAPEPLSSCVRSQGLSRGSRSNAMSRLLPLLGSRTVRSLRPGPAAAPRPPSWCGCGRGLLALGVPGGSRLLGTHPKKEPMEALNTAQGARDFIYSLHSTERSCLLKELHRFESIAIAQEKLEALPPTPGQLRYVFFHNAIPFIGFGFLDNAIMIVAGTHIELSIGIILGISTMAAAALGNLVSDLAGLGLAGYVEALASRLGLSIPDLTPKQVDMWQTRVSTHLGKAVGVTIGCILGMFPLFFFGGGEEDEKLETTN
ncbi:Transmembrane protein 65, partial [Lemmus lemmus]